VGSTAGTEPAAVPAPPSRKRRKLLAFAAAAVAFIVVIAVLAAEGGKTTPRHLQAAKTFSLPQLGHPGQDVSLAGFAGRPVIVSFFASWCGPCKRETPLLARFYHQHSGRIAVIGIDSNDQQASGLRFARAADVTYPIGFDQFPSPVAISYGISVLPQTFMLNAKHQIVRHIFGAVTGAQLTAWANGLVDSGRS
jgi:thiol-disulfide isomerase/thioredoxin